jgi:hypothetical protein
MCLLEEVRMRMWTALVVLVGWVVAASAAWSQPRLTEDPSGVSVTVPPRWRGVRGDDPVVFVLLPRRGGSRIEVLHDRVEAAGQLDVLFRSIPATRDLADSLVVLEREERTIGAFQGTFTLSSMGDGDTLLRVPVFEFLHGTLLWRVVGLLDASVYEEQQRVWFAVVEGLSFARRTGPRRARMARRCSRCHDFRTHRQGPGRAWPRPPGAGMSVGHRVGWSFASGPAIGVRTRGTGHPPRACPIALRESGRRRACARRPHGRSGRRVSPREAFMRTWLSLVVLVGWTLASGPAWSQQQLTDANRGVSVTMPEGWETVSGNDRALFNFKEPTSFAQVEIIDTELVTGEVADVFFNTFHETLSGSEFSLLGREERTIGSLTGTTSIYAFTHSSVPLRVAVFQFVNQNVAWLVVGYMEESVYDDQVGAWTSVIESLAFGS